MLQYPGLETVMEDLLPKKSPLIVVKWFVMLTELSFSSYSIPDYISLGAVQTILP